MKVNTLYNLDCRIGLNQMIKEGIKVNTVVSSPPYWALRVYDIKPLIWDGNPECEHEFKLIIENVEGYNNTRRRWQHGATRDTEPETWNKSIKQYGFCSRCFAWKGHLGMEPSIELYIKHLCDIYDLVKEVLQDFGTNWVNLGDTYGGSGNSSGHTKNTKNLTRNTSEYGASKGNQKYTKGYEKCLLMIPERFAIEMINRGWILRNKIIWEKENPMPSSAKDRFTRNYEFIYFFAKNNKPLYWINQKNLILINKKPLGTKGIEDIDWRWVICSRCNGIGKEEDTDKKCTSCKGMGKKKRTYWKGKNYFFKQQLEPISNKKATQERYKYASAYNSNFKNKGNKSKPTKPFSKHWVSMRNMRSVWNIPTKPCKEAHFAVFPDTLIETPIKAGCPKLVCKECNNPRERIYKETEAYKRLKQKWRGVNLNGDIYIGRNRETGYPGHISREIEFIGHADCGCNKGYRPGLLLDPFAGIGTSLLTAWRLGRDFIGFELSKKYFEIAKKKMVVTKNSRLDNFITVKNNKDSIKV